MCVGSGGAGCAASGTGDIDATLEGFPAGGSLAYTITGTVPLPQAWEAAAAATVPEGMEDPTPGNNAATARGYVVLLPLARRPA